MKTNELMIGDWVQVPSELNRKKQIKSTFDLDSAVLYQPIPLTHEILENNGFSRHEDEYQLLDDYWELYLEEINDGMWQVVEYNDEFGNIPIQVVNISHVHEFQHFLRLCAIEFNFKL